MPEPNAPMFAPPADRSDRRFPTGVVVIVGLLVAILTGVLVAVSGRHHAADPNRVLPLAPDAASLSLSHLAMSESTSLSGGKSTFLDGQITNHGTATVLGVTVQVLFANDESMPPHLETTPLALIRTREPYIDTEPIAAAPLHAGDTRDFRLIFESVPGNWNQQMPEVHVVRITR